MDARKVIESAVKDRNVPKAYKSLILDADYNAEDAEYVTNYLLAHIGNSMANSNIRKGEPNDKS